MVEKTRGWPIMENTRMDDDCGWDTFRCSPKATVVVRQLAAGETLYQLSSPSNVSQALRAKLLPSSPTANAVVLPSIGTASRNSLRRACQQRKCR